MVKERKIYLDYLRVFACLSVVLSHVLLTAKSVFPNNSEIEKIICRTIPSFLHYAVPIFFIITGILFLSKNKTIELKEYYKKYVLKYVIVTIVFAGVYAFIEEIYNHNPILDSFWTAFVNMICGKTWAHMWYMYYLIGVMIALPFFKKIVDTNDKSIIRYTLIVLFTSSILIPFLNNVFNIKIGLKIPLSSTYIFYVMYGFYIDKYITKKIKNIYLILIGIIASISIFVFQYLSFKNTHLKLNFLSTYNSIVILILTTCLFFLFKNIFVKNSRLKFVNWFIDTIRKESFEIYLIHMFYINLVYKFFKFNIFGSIFILKLLIVYIGVVLASVITSIALKKIPFVKKVLT